MASTSRPAYETPSIDAVEKVLYIALREETDALRNQVMPGNYQPGSLLYVQYIDGVLNVCEFPERRLAPSKNNDKLWQRLAEQRSWYYRWLGMGVGLSILPRDMVATLKSHVAHVDAHRRFGHVHPLEAHVQFMNTQLYVPKLPKSDRAIIR